MLVSIDVVQEHLYVQLLLHVEDYLGRKVDTDSHKNGASNHKIFIPLRPLIHHKALREDVNDAAHNKVKEEV